MTLHRDYDAWLEEPYQRAQEEGEVLEDEDPDDRDAWERALDKEEALAAQFEDGYYDEFPPPPEPGAGSRCPQCGVRIHVSRYSPKPPGDGLCRQCTAWVPEGDERLEDEYDAI